MFLFLRREGWKTFLPMILISFDVEWLLTDLAPRPELLIIIWMRLPTSIFQKSGSRFTSFFIGSHKIPIMTSVSFIF